MKRLVNSKQSMSRLTRKNSWATCRYICRWRFGAASWWLYVWQCVPLVDFLDEFLFIAHWRLVVLQEHLLAGEALLDSILVRLRNISVLWWPCDLYRLRIPDLLCGLRVTLWTHWVDYFGSQLQLLLFLERLLCQHLRILAIQEVQETAPVALVIVWDGLIVLFKTVV